VDRILAGPPYIPFCMYPLPKLNDVSQDIGEKEGKDLFYFMIRVDCTLGMVRWGFATF
jgi:hypothetical protein